MNLDKSDAQRGLYNKFKVERVDGSSGPGGKHESCEYFVLDLMHDPHAYAAVQAYARSCRHDYPRLANDLVTKLVEMLTRDRSQKNHETDSDSGR
jgi:hypothetical protein